MWKNRTYIMSETFSSIQCEISMVLKTGPDRPVRPVGPPIGHRSGSVRSLDRMETESGLDRLNRRSNQWIGRTGRFWGKKPVQIILIFFLVFQMLIFNLHIPISKINEDMNFIFISMQKSSWIFKHWHVMFLFWVII